ncbi:MAG: Uma2 family endonuclease, partial [Isosphaeraceae bacterium]
MATVPSVLTLGPEDHGRLLTAEEFAEASYAEPWKYEREQGRLIVMPPDGPDHDDCSEPVRDLLGAYRVAHPDLVEKVVSEAWIRVDEGTDRIGDIGVFLVGPRSSIQRPERVPELMFEIVSPDRESRDRDYVKKRRTMLVAKIKGIALAIGTISAFVSGAVVL